MIITLSQLLLYFHLLGQLLVYRWIIMIIILEPGCCLIIIVMIALLGFLFIRPAIIVVLILYVLEYLWFGPVVIKLGLHFLNWRRGHWSWSLRQGYLDGGLVDFNNWLWFLLLNDGISFYFNWLLFLPFEVVQKMVLSLYFKVLYLRREHSLRHLVVLISNTELNRG